MMSPVSQSRSQGEAPPLLAMTGLVKRFTGTLALDHVDFDVRRGEVHALLGQNGAGKSTLIKVLAGVYKADAGAILFAGEPAHPGTEALPIAFIHQDLGLVEWMTVAENVAIQTGYPRSRAGLISWPKVNSAAAEALAIMGSDLDPETPISSLPAAERSLVAIGRALAIKSDILVLDEPTAALPEADVERLLETLRRLRASNIGIVYVTHRLDEVLRIADRVTVLRDGRRLATVAASETNAGELVQMIVGRSMSDAFVRPTQPSDRGALSVEDLVAEHVGPVSFSVAAGETLGLVGLRGAGHHTVGRAIFGHTPMDSRPADARRRADRASEPGRSDGQGRRLRIEPPSRGGPRLEPRRARKYLPESDGERQRRAGIRLARDASSAKPKRRCGAFPSRRRGWRSQLRRCPAAINRKWSSRAGWRRMLSSSFSRSRRSASTSAPRRTSTICCSCRCARDWRCC